MRFLVRSVGLWLITACALGLAAPVAAAQTIPGGDWSPGAGAAGDNTYNGFVDNPSTGASISPGGSFRVSGWIVDTTAEGWAGIDDVQVLNGGTVLGHAAVGTSRPDVAAATGNPYWANSGFDGVIPSTGLSGAVTLTIAAHTPGKGTWTKQVGVNVGSGGGVTTTSTATGLVLTIIFPSPSDEIVANDNGTIRGTAFDTRTRAELGVGVDRVEVALDGPRGQAGSQPLGIATQTGNTWALDWEPTKYDHVKHHVLFVYAHSSVTGEERLLNQEITLD